MHREIRKYIYTEFFKNKENFYIEDELFNITKIHNNKVHTTTKRIPKEIRDILDITEIEHINQEILKTLTKKIKIMTLSIIIKAMYLIIIKFILLIIRF